ncbi:hypothetical protein BH11PAT3_BH11PAT3_2820 [soil metagenome]
MNDSLFNIFKTLPELPQQAGLLSRIHKEIFLRKVKIILTFSITVLFASFIASLWYLYAGMIEFDSFTITKIAFSTLELDMDSINESFSFFMASLPLLALIIFVINSTALGGLVYVRRLVQNSERSPNLFWKAG